MYMKRKYESLEEIADAVRVCTKCPLCKTRKMSVPGNGSTSAKIMFIGEAPGRSEDLRGRPFAGYAGKKLDEALKLQDSQVIHTCASCTCFTRVANISSYC